MFSVQIIEFHIFLVNTRTYEKAQHSENFTTRDIKNHHPKIYQETVRLDIFSYLLYFR